MLHFRIGREPKRAVLLAIFLGSLLLAESAAPIPEPTALLQEVQAQQRKMDAVRENYTFHRIRQVDDVDQKGAVIKTLTLEREIFYVKGHEIRRLVKRNGAELSPVLVMKSFRQNVHVKDFERFDVGTVQQIGPLR